MKIHSLHIPALNRRLENLERERNPTPDQLAALDVINEAMESVRTVFKGNGFTALGDDRARVLEAVIFWLLFE